MLASGSGQKWESRFEGFFFHITYLYNIWIFHYAFLTRILNMFSTYVLFKTQKRQWDSQESFWELPGIDQINHNFHLCLMVLIYYYLIGFPGYYMK